MNRAATSLTLKHSTYIYKENLLQTPPRGQKPLEHGERANLKGASQPKDTDRQEKRTHHQSHATGARHTLRQTPIRAAVWIKQTLKGPKPKRTLFFPASYTHLPILSHLSTITKMRHLLSYLNKSTLLVKTIHRHFQEFSPERNRTNEPSLLLRGFDPNPRNNPCQERTASHEPSHRLPGRKVPLRDRENRPFSPAPIWDSSPNRPTIRQTHNIRLTGRPIATQARYP
ncbi:hypothetical protein APED_07105 [Acanthopleuribacter pedis]